MYFSGNAGTKFYEKSMHGNVGEKMLMQEATPEMIEGWKAAWNEYKDKVKPGRKAGNDVAAYLAARYILRKLHDKRATAVVTSNVLQNAPLAEKLPEGARPSPVAFIVENEGNGKKLYQEQDEVFQGEIFVGIDLVSGCYIVEGSSLLWDELCAFQGLDEKDIQNYFCVAQYVFALKKFGLLQGP